MRKGALVFAVSAVAPMASGCMSASNGEFSAPVPRDPAVVAQGEDAFQRCQGCHSVSPDGPSRAGPNLHGIFGQVAGTRAGFPYTDALSRSGITWDVDTLDAFLADPSGYVPGSEMRRGTVIDANQRRAIIAYLASLRVE